MKAVIILYSIVVLFNWPVDSRKCYECSCYYNWGTFEGTCYSTEFQASCILIEVGNEYCLMTINYNGNLEQRTFIAVAPDTFQDSHFFQAVEVISLSNTTWLPTVISYISYGCDWDGCTNNSLAQYLPESFQMKINETILNSALVDGQSSAQACETCSACINSLTAILCKPEPCTNGICYIDELHNYIITPARNCTYNFYSYCQQLTTPPQTPTIRIRATYYIDFPEEKQFQIDEVDITCTKDYCNTIVTVEDLKGQIQRNITIHPDFRPPRPNDTTTTTEKPTDTTTTTEKPTEESKSTRLYPVVFLYLTLILLLL